eukprot:g4526.t1
MPSKKKSDEEWAIIVFGKNDGSGFDNEQQFKKVSNHFFATKHSVIFYVAKKLIYIIVVRDHILQALRSLSSHVGLISDGELDRIWAEVSSGGILSEEAFKTLYASLGSRYKRKIQSGVKPNVNIFNEYCDGEKSPFDILKDEGVSLNMDGIEKILAEKGDVMSSAEFHDILSSCPGVEDLIQDGDFGTAIRGLQTVINRAIPEPKK